MWAFKSLTDVRYEENDRWYVFVELDNDETGEVTGVCLKFKDEPSADDAIETAEQYASYLNTPPEPDEQPVEGDV